MNGDRVVKDVRKILTTLVERVDHIIEMYGDKFLNLHENYTLLMLLYVREYEAGFPKGAASLAWLIDRAADGKDSRGLVNFTSLHRAITIAKKKFQNEKDRVRSDEKESEYQNVLAGWDDDEVDWGDTDV